MRIPSLFSPHILPIFLLGCGSYDWCARLNLDCATESVLRPAVVDEDGDVWVADTAGGADCDDARSDVYPGAPEICDGADNDCDGEVDEGGGAVGYQDADLDGYGVSFPQKVLCAGPELGWAFNDMDCDDLDSQSFPGAPEQCDEQDNDCDGTVDDGVVQDHYADLDGDGYGVDGTGVAYCVGEAPTELVREAGDCDDTSALASPLVEERCEDGRDNDCDDEVDEAEDCVASGAWLYLQEASAQVGFAVSGGDLGGDGHADLVVGAPQSSQSVAREGAVYIISGPLSADTNLARQDAVLLGEQVGSAMGNSVDVVGDVDGDGLLDLLVGSPGRREGGLTLAGSAHLFLGPLTGTLRLRDADASFPGEQADLRQGWWVTGLEDMGGDGLPDLLVGQSSRSTRAFTIFDGTVRGIVSLAGRRADVLVNSTDTGSMRATSADVSGDGVADLLMGYPTNSVGRGSIFGFYGPVTADVSITFADLEWRSDTTGDQLAYSLAAPGDVNGDGYADVVLGAPYRDTSANDAGSAYLLYGPLTGEQILAADVEWTGEAAGDLLGLSVAGAGDGDLDGLPEILLGAGRQNSDVDSPEQVAVSRVGGELPGVYRIDAVERLQRTISNPADSTLVLTDGLDLSADGIPDVIVGVPNYAGYGAAAGGVRIFTTPTPSPSAQ